MGARSGLLASLPDTLPMARLREGLRQRPFDIPPFMPDWLDDQDGAPAKRHRLRFRTVWISDVHLGTAGCNAEYLLDFLKSIECETLYLVGDIIDMWRLRKGWYWPPRHNDIV